MVCEQGPPTRHLRSSLGAYSTQPEGLKRVGPTYESSPHVEHRVSKREAGRKQP